MRSARAGVKVRAVMYHDIVEAGAWESSGFPGAGAAVYKLERGEFARHLAAIHAALPPGCVIVAEQLPREGGPPPVLLTFDDGGVSAYDATAGMLEEHGWRGHFFVTTDRIGAPGFLSAAQIRDLRARGHLIGSHSCSHPTRMSACTREQLDREWRDSLRLLEDILGERVTAASVPGGYYSEEVGRSAAAAGVRLLFTSEPTAEARRVDSCLLLGRYFAQRGMPPETSAGFAAGRLTPCLRQAASWKFKKVVKALGGAAYLEARERWLSRRRG